MLSVISKQQFFVLFACDCQGHLACNRHHPHLKSADHVTNADVNVIIKHSPIWLTMPTFRQCPHKPILVTRCSFQLPNQHLACETTPSPPSFPYLSDRAQAPPQFLLPSTLTSSLRWCSVFWGERNGREICLNRQKRHQQATLASIATN